MGECHLPLDISRRTPILKMLLQRVLGFGWINLKRRLIASICLLFGSFYLTCSPCVCTSNRFHFGIAVRRCDDLIKSQRNHYLASFLSHNLNSRGIIRSERNLLWMNYLDKPDLKDISHKADIRLYRYQLIYMYVYFTHA